MGSLVITHNSSLRILEVDRQINADITADFLNVLPFISVSLLGLPVNTIIITWILVVKEKTLIDDMILYDCFANIGFLLGLSFRLVHLEDDIFCTFVLTFVYFFAVFNRVIPVTIVLYRYILVCHDQTADTIGKSKLGRILNFLTILIPSLLTLLTLFFPNDFLHYLICTSREELFHYELGDFFASPVGGLLNKNPIFHPTRIGSIVVTNAYAVVVPLGYYKIYTFIEGHNQGVPGITNAEFRRRRHKNRVTIGFNLSVWLLEFLAMLIVNFSTANLYDKGVIFAFITCAIAPLLYLLGMSEVRDSTEARRTLMMEKMRASWNWILEKRNNTVYPS